MVSGEARGGCVGCAVGHNLADYIDRSVEWFWLWNIVVFMEHASSLNYPSRSAVRSSSTPTPIALCYRRPPHLPSALPLSREPISLKMLLESWADSTKFVEAIFKTPLWGTVKTCCLGRKYRGSDLCKCGKNYWWFGRDLFVFDELFINALVCIGFLPVLWSTIVDCVVDRRRLQISAHTWRTT